MDHGAGAIDTLEDAQRAAATRGPLPRRKLGRGTVALLILLRIYVIIAIPLVGYAFVHALGTPAG
jgi:hypothetical protein